MSKNIQNVEVSGWSIVRFLLILLGFFAIYVIRDVAVALLFAVIVASAMEPAILWLKQRRIPRIISVILVYLAVAAVFFLLIYLIVPIFIDEFKGVSITYPILQKQVLSGFERIQSIPFVSAFDLDFEKLFSVPAQILQRAGGGILNFASSVFGGAFTLVLIVVFSFYLAAQEKGIETFLRLVSPIKHEQYIIDLWGRSQKKLGRWFRAQLLLGVIVGVFIFLGLTFLGIEHALFFALLAAMFEIVPVAGPILAAVPAVIVGFLVSPLLGLSTIILYAAVQQIESQVIVPVVMRKAVGLSPIIVVLAILTGAKLGGILGILLSIPVTVIAAEFLADWDKRKRVLSQD